MFSAGPHNLRRYGRAVATAAFPMPASQGAEPSVATTLRRFSTHNSAALVWTDDVLVPGVNGNPQFHLYSDSPRIAVVSLAPAENGGFTETYDLRRDWLCGVARAAAADALVADRKIWYAALEGALEHESVARDAAMVGADPSAARSTSALLTADGVVALGAADIQRLPQLVKDAETIARLREVLRAGSIAVVPRSALASGARGWWEVMPNGDTRAVLDGLNSGAFTSTGAPSQLPPVTDPLWDARSAAEIAKDAASASAAAGGEGTTAEGAAAVEAALSAGTRGNEWLILTAKMASVAIVVGTVFAVYVNHRNTERANAELEAWNAAEEAKQQAALAAARRQ
jgi:hypothetical protein